MATRIEIISKYPIPVRESEKALGLPVTIVDVYSIDKNSLPYNWDASHLY